MKILVKAPARMALESLSEWIESRNTKGSGLRWLNNFHIAIEKSMKAVHALPYCKFPEFKSKGLTCLLYKDWIVACKIIDGNLVIYAVVHGSWLS